VKDEDVAVEIALLKQSVSRHEEEIEQLKKEKDELKLMATRWKGFGAALIALGGMAGAVFAELDHIKELFGWAVKSAH
jgi:hypothetical protein